MGSKRAHEGEDSLDTPKLSTCTEEVRRRRLPERVDTLLARNLKRDPDAPEAIYSYFLGRLRTLSENQLYPSTASPDATGATPPAIPGTSTPDGPGIASLPGEPPEASQYDRADIDWSALSQNLRAAAEHIWRDVFLQDATDAASRERLRGRKDLTALRERRRLEFLTRQARGLLLLWVEARFYYVRMTANFQFYKDIASEEDSGESIIVQFRTILTDYRGILRAWDRALFRVARQHYFASQVGDAQRLKALSEEFGPQKMDLEEVGWSAQAAAANSELRFQHFDALRRERWHDPRRWLSALWLQILKYVIGYGIRPGRFLVATMAAVGIFAAFYFAADVHSGCTTNPYAIPSQWPGIGLSVAQHIGLAIANLVGGGPIPRPCTAIGHALTITETFIGYFLLAILAALLIEQLTPDRA